MILTDTEREIKEKQLRSLHEDLRLLSSISNSEIQKWSAVVLEARRLEEDLRRT